jgi:hypothetical protein
VSTATPLEWSLAAVIGVGLLVMIWLTYDAVRDQGWVEGRRQESPDLDWSSAQIQASTGLVQMVILAAVQGIYMLIATILLFTAPAGPPRPPTPQGIVTQVGLIVTELLLVGLALYLRWRRKVLVENVGRIGGD